MPAHEFLFLEIICKYKEVEPLAVENGRNRQFNASPKDPHLKLVRWCEASVAVIVRGLTQKANGTPAAKRERFRKGNVDFWERY